MWSLLRPAGWPFPRPEASLIPLCIVPESLVSFSFLVSSIRLLAYRSSCMFEDSTSRSALSRSIFSHSSQVFHLPIFKSPFTFTCTFTPTFTLRPSFTLPSIPLTRSRKY